MQKFGNKKLAKTQTFKNFKQNRVYQRHKNVTHSQ